MAAIFMFASPVLAGPPFKVGDITAIYGALCLEEGHIEMVDSLEEDFNEGPASNGEQSRADEEWQRQAALGNCWVLQKAWWLKIKDITEGGMSIFGKIWEIAFEVEPGRPNVYALWFERGTQPERLSRKPKCVGVKTPSEDCFREWSI